MNAAMTHDDEFLENDDRPRSSNLAAGVVGIAYVCGD